MCARVELIHDGGGGTMVEPPRDTREGGRGRGAVRRHRLGLLVLGEGEAQLSHQGRSPVVGEGRKVLKSRG